MEWRLLAKKLILAYLLIFLLFWCFNDFYVFTFFGFCVFANKVWELLGGGSVAVTVGVNDMRQVIGDI